MFAVGLKNSLLCQEIKFLFWCFYMFLFIFTQKWSWNSFKCFFCCCYLLKKPWCWERLRAGGEGETEDEMVVWHHWLNGHEFEQSPGIGDGQGSLACCSLWGHKESDTTERLNWTELKGRVQLYQKKIRKNYLLIIWKEIMDFKKLTNISNFIKSQNNIFAN